MANGGLIESITDPTRPMSSVPSPLSSPDSLPSKLLSPIASPDLVKEENNENTEVFEVIKEELKEEEDVKDEEVKDNEDEVNKELDSELFLDESDQINEKSTMTVDDGASGDSASDYSESGSIVPDAPMDAETFVSIPPNRCLFQVQCAFFFDQFGVSVFANSLMP